MVVKTSSSAVAEGPRDALISRNSATTKHPIWKLESRAYRVALFAWSTFSHFHAILECDRHTHTDRQTNGRTDIALRRAVKIEDIALHTKYNYQATSAGW